MTRVLEIASCRECPFRVGNIGASNIKPRCVTDGKRIFKSITNQIVINKGKYINDLDKIADFCPLKEVNHD